MEKTFTVTGTLKDGEKHEIKTCCERDVASRLSVFGGIVRLDQPHDLPRTCPTHSYTPPAEAKARN